MDNQKDFREDQTAQDLEVSPEQRADVFLEEKILSSVSGHPAKIRKDYIFSNNFYKNVDAMVSTSGLEHCEPSHSYGPAVRSAYMIHYVLDGKGFYWWNNQIWYLKKGDAFFIQPGELIYYKADDTDPWTYTWVGMQGAKIPEYLARTSLMKDPILHFDENNELARLMLEMYEVPVSPNSDLAFNGLLYQYLYELCLQFPARKLEASSQSDQYVQEILNVIEGRIDQPVSIQELAAEMSLDRSYLAKIFKKKMGMSMKEYQTSIRITNACSLLTSTSLSVSEIARSCGYEDVLYFSRAFKKVKSCSPSEYRKNHGNLLDQVTDTLVEPDRNRTNKK